jgi:hypothetical protein
MKTKTGARQRGEPELMGVKEAAETIGVRPSNLPQIAGLPEPYDKVAATTLYRAAEMRAFAKNRYDRRHPVLAA